MSPSNAKPLTEGALRTAMTTLGVPRAPLWALLAVESTGCGFLPDRRPKVLFERHVFRRLTHNRFDASHPNLSRPERGGYLGGAPEWSRVHAASLIDRTAAYGATSWGLPQIMGHHHRDAGHPTLDAMVEAFASSEDAHLAALVGFVAASPKMNKALRAMDWGAFAALYNGPAYRLHHYDSRLARAWAAMSRSAPSIDLRAVQVALMFLGHDPGPIDGFPGRRTDSALRAFADAQDCPIVAAESAAVAAAWPH